MIKLYQSQRTIGKIVMPRQVLKLLVAISLFIVALPAQLSAQSTLDRLGLTAATPTAGAYSLRLLSNSYTGPLVRIRIVNNYFDVYPDGNKRFSVSSNVARYTDANAPVAGASADIVANNIGSQHATVVIWYDQSGNGNNAIQTNTSLQPQVINAGVVNTLNGLPTVKFSGAEWLVVTTAAFNNDLSGSIVYSATSSNTSSNSPQAWYVMNGILGSEQPSAINDFGYGIFNGKFTAGNGSNDNSFATTANVNDGASRINSWTRSNASGAITLFSMMQTNGSATLNAGTRSNVSSVAIGSIATFGGGQFNGSLSEMILAPSVYTSVVRKAIEGNQATYFSVALPATATNATLSALSLSTGTLNTTFASGTTSYTTSVSSATSSITLTPTSTVSVDPTIEVRVNGGAYTGVNSGAASASLALNQGNNNVDIKVTAANGINTQVYTVTVNRSAAQVITFNTLPAKVYGDIDFSPGATASSGLPVSYSSSNTNVATIVGNNIHIVGAGTATITASQSGDSTYPAATDITQSLIVAKRPITVLPGAKTKVYGDADPYLNQFQVTAGSIAPGGATGGAFGRAEGENAGTYLMTLGDKKFYNSEFVEVTSSYDITVQPAYFIITKNPNNTITFDAVTKNYGDADFSPATASSSVAVTYSSDNTNVATIVNNNIHLVGIGTANITASNAGDLNWGPAPNVIQTLTVNKGTAIVTATPQTKIYGNADPVFTYTATGVVNGDAPTGALAVTLPSGNAAIGNYAITQGTLSYGSKYNVTYIGADLTITKRLITLRPVPANKVYGNADPTYPYQFVAGSVAPGEGMTGTFGRQPGENIGAYALSLGTKRPVSIYTPVFTGENYTISFISDNLTITSRPITVTANAQTKVAGRPDPNLTFTSDGLINGDVLSGSLSRAAGETPGTYAITQGTLANSNYDISFTPGVLTITPASTNADLSTLTLSIGTLSPAFDANTIAYNATVSAATASIDITATVADATATITYGGQIYASGSAISIALNPGENIIPLLLTAESGAEKTYTLTVYKAVVLALAYDGGPYTFQVGDAISDIVPATSGVSAFGYNTAKQVIGSGVQYPQSAAVDTAGAVYATDGITKNIQKFNTDGSVDIINTGLLQPVPIMVATDGLSNLYAWQTGTATVLKYAYGSSSPVTVPLGGITSIQAIAFDAANNMYVTNSLERKVYKLPVNGGVPVQLPGTFPAPYGITVDGNNNVYVSTSLAHKVFKIPGGTGTAVEVGTGFNQPVGLYADASGNVFVTDRGNSAIKMIPATNQATTVTIATGISYMFTVTADTKGNLYVSDELSTGVSKFQPSGGYFASRLLPAGLTLDNATGAISGTTLESSHVTDYTITAWNNYGQTKSAPVTMNVISNNAFLANLTLSAGTLNPAFNKDSLTYNIDVTAKTPTIAITAFAADTTATITVNGNAVASGHASGNIALAAGANTITVDVLAQDGVTAKTYTLTVNRGLSDNANLTLSIYPSEALVKYSGGPANVDYKVSVSAAISEVQLFAKPQHPATTVIVDGMTVPAGSRPDPIYLDGDTTYIHITAIAPSGYVRTYSVMVTKTGSNNADATFTINTDAKLVKAATGPAGVNYTTVVSNATNTIQVFPLSYNPAAVVKIGGNVIPDGSPSAPIPLNATGPTVIHMTVTSETGTSTRTYSITVTKTASKNANAYFVLSNRPVLMSTTGPAGKNYFASVAASTPSVTVTPKTEDPNATVTINGIPVAGNTASAPVTLTADTTVILISVTAENGLVTKTYSIAIARNGSNNSLARISLSNGAILEPYFGSADKNYIALLSPEVSSVGIIAIPQDVNARVYINGVLSPAKTPVPVTVVPDDATYVDVEVHAQDSSTVTTYSIILAPLGSGNYNATFALSPKATLVKVPNVGCGCGEEATYATSVDAATPAVKLTTFAKDTAATIYVNGILTDNRTASEPITLNDDAATTIIVDVVSEVGLPKTYYIIVNKTGSNLTDAVFALLPKSELVKTKTGAAQLNYTTTVAAGQTSLKIKPRTIDPNAAIVINGSLIARGDTATVALNSGVTVITGLVTAQDGTTTKSFSIAVSRNGSNNALARLKINSGTVLVKTIGSGYQNYITSVPTARTDIGITPVLEDAGATVTINGLAVTAGAVSLQTLTADTSVFNIQVTAQDGITVKRYTLKVLKNGSNVATANFAVHSTSKLKEVTSGPAQTNFTLSVSPLAAALVVTPRLTDAHATVSINGMPAADGTPSDPITLNTSGPTLISMLVTAEDGVSTRSYSIMVSPDGSNIADVSISLAPKAALVRVAGTAAGNFQAIVDTELRVVKVKIQRADTNAVVTINGATTTTLVTPVTLTGDTTMVNITSVAEDGVTTKVYTIALIKNTAMRMLAATAVNKTDIIANASLQLKSPVTDLSTSTKGITIYPNPFIDQLKIDLKGYNAKEAHVTITTLQARELFNQKLPVTDNKVELNVSHLKQGIYIINISVNGERKGYRIVKN